MMKSSLQVAITALMGGLAGIVFIFLFPMGAISTLVHDVFHLPGPGAGIAIVVGPFIVFFMLMAYRENPNKGFTLLTALFFSITLFLVVNIGKIAVDTKGMFGSGWFILVVVICSIGAEIMLQLTRKMTLFWRSLITAAVANLILLISYWLIIFPQSAGWIAWRHIPILSAACLAGGFTAGVCVWVIARLF